MFGTLGTRQRRFLTAAAYAKGGRGGGGVQLRPQAALHRVRIPLSAQCWPQEVFVLSMMLCDITLHLLSALWDFTTNSHPSRSRLCSQGKLCQLDFPQGRAVFPVCWRVSGLRPLQTPLPAQWRVSPRPPPAGLPPFFPLTSGTCKPIIRFPRFMGTRMCSRGHPEPAHPFFSG